MSDKRTQALSVRPSVELGDLVAEYGRAIDSTGKGSTARRHVYYLRKMIADFTWTTTSDVPIDAFAQMNRRWGPYTARMCQWAIIALIRWARARFFFHEELLTKPMTPAPELHGAVWGDDVREYILTQLKNCEVLDNPRSDPRRRSKKRRSGVSRANSVSRRSTLYPLIYMVLTWAVRRSEIVDLRVGDWSASTCVLTIRRSTTRRANARSFKVDNETAAILNDVVGNRDSDEYLFRSRQGKKWRALHLSKQVRLLMRQMGMRGSLVECHRAAVRRLITAHAENPQAVLGITGICELRYLRTYTAKRQGYAAARRRSQQVYDDVMVAFHEAQGDVSGSPEAVNPDPGDGFDMRDLVSGIIAQRGSGSSSHRTHKRSD